MSVTTPSKNEDVIKYQKYLEMAGKWAERNFTRRADRMVNYYEINHYQDKDANAKQNSWDRIKVPYPYANTRQIMAEILPTNPQPIVKPTQRPKLPKPPKLPYLNFWKGNSVKFEHDPVKCAQKIKDAVNYCQDHSNIEDEFSMMTLYGVSTGFGALMIQAQKNSKVPKWESFTHRELHFACYAVKNPYKSPWVARKIVRELDDIKDDSYYNSNKQYVNASKPEAEMFRTDDSLTFTPGVSYGILWDFYNLKDDKHLIFPDGQSFELLSENISDIYKFRPTDDEFKTDSPFVFFINEESITSPYGMGDIYPIESQVRELDKTRTQQINHRKRYNRKYMVRENTLGTDGENQLKNPDDGTLITIKGQQPFDQSIAPLEDAQMSADVYQVDDIIQRDIQLIQPIGPNSLVRGVGEQPDTLGQSQIIEQNSNNRLGAKQKVLAKCYGRVFSLTAQYIQQYWITSDSLLVKGDGANTEDWLDFSPEEFQGEYEYDVVPESLRDNSVVYRQQINQALETVAPIYPVLQQAPGLAIMVRKYLEQFETLAKEVDEIVPEEWTKPQAQDPIGMPGQNPDGQLQQLLQQMGPQALLDKIQGLPENERQILTAKIQQLMQGGQGGQPPPPNPSVPTNQSIIQGAMP